MTLGKYIKKIRIENALTVREFAAKTGVAHSTIYFVEKDEKKPHLSTLRKIAHAFDIPFSDFAQYI